MLWESIHKKEFCIISIYHHNIIIIYNLRVISILVRVIKSLRCSIHIIIFNHCTVALHFSYFLHCEQFPFTQHQIVTAPPHRGLQIPRQLMLKSEAEVETEVVVSDINITPFFWHWHWNTRLCPNPFTLLFLLLLPKTQIFCSNSSESRDQIL